MFVAYAQGMGGGDDPDPRKSKAPERGYEAEGRSACEKLRIRTGSKECKCSSNTFLFIRLEMKLLFR